MIHKQTSAGLQMKLAIFTNKPTFDKPLYVGTPIVEKEVRESYFKYMGEVFERNWLTNNGPLVQKLEEKIAKIHGVKHCIAVCNATIGEILVLKALNLEREVILPSFTFISTAHACLWQGAKTIFCDISPDTLGIDPDKAEKLITKNTCAIIGVHLFGNTCDIKRLSKLSKKHNLKLIFDAAHAFNCYYGDKPVGCFGDAVILSFHATKFFGTFEGGAVLTDNPELSVKLRFLRNFGFRTYDEVSFLGINGKMTESHAAMGLASLDFLESRAGLLKENYAVYCRQLSAIPGIRVLQIGREGKSNYQYVVIFVDKIKFGLSRDLLYRILWRENVIARRYFYPGCHRMEPYKTSYPEAYKRLSVTEDIAANVLCLPSGFKEPQKEISKIVNIIKLAHDEADAVLKSQIGQEKETHE